MTWKEWTAIATIIYMVLVIDIDIDTKYLKFNYVGWLNADRLVKIYQDRKINSEKKKEREVENVGLDENKRDS